MGHESSADEEAPLSRRNVLQAVGTVGALAAASGVGSAGGTAEFNVGIEPGAQRAERAVREAADSVRTSIDFGHVGKTLVGEFGAQARAALANNPNVRYVERNGEMEKLAETLPWGVDRVDADVLHGNGDTGAGATVAVLDTGIDDDHPDLQANVVGGKAFETECGAESGGCRFGGEGYNNNDCNYTWSDDDDHGSHVAGTSDAVDNSRGVIGVATEADLLAGKVLTGCGSGSYSAIASGVKWATDQGADVINMSLGGDSGSSTLQDACQYAYDNNVVTVAAAGNSGPCSDCVGYPAAYDTVVAVSATTPSDALADYSSTGPEVEIAAPGGANDGNDSTSVLSTIPPESDDTDGDGYAYYVGTSMATPHVAGAAAQVKAESDLTDNQQIIDRLKSTAEDIGLASNESGAGLLDAEAAVGSGGSNSAPAVDSLSASEVETSDGDAEFDVSWQVSDGDGNLSSVDLSLTDDTDGQSEDSASVSVSGSDASGTTRLVAASDDGSGNSYTVDLTVTDGDGASASDSTGVSETESTNAAPSASIDSLNDRSNPRWDRYEVDWSASDSDGNLDTVVVELLDAGGSTLDSVTTNVSGASASGLDEVRSKGTAATVAVTATDTDGASDSDSRSI